MSLVRVGTKNQVVIPKSVRTRLGVGPGDYVEIAYEKNRALIKPKKVVDRDEPLGPKTRAALRQALKEVKEGKAGPPLRTQQELQDFLDKLKAKNRN